MNGYDAIMQGRLDLRNLTQRYGIEINNVFISLYRQGKERYNDFNS